MLKNYYEPDEDKQEIPIENYVADIFTGEEIIEIQTRQLNKLRDKLTTFLKLYPVTVVYPIPREKYLIWVDEESGELSNRRKSPLKGSAYLAFSELYKIKMFLLDPNLRMKLVLIDMEEYRILNGYSKDRKKGSTRFDRIPYRIDQEVDLRCPKDYMQFIPYDITEPFTAKEFAKAAHVRAGYGNIILNILFHMGVVERVGKSGNSYLYKAGEY